MTTSRHALRAMACAGLVLALAACGSTRYGRRLQLPPEARLYVAVFVDESEQGRVGVPLADAVRVEVYRRDPSRLSMTFDEGTWVLDGTVVAVEEAPGEAGRMTLTITTRARLLDKGGATVATLGPATASESYRIFRERGQTEAHREEALERAVRELAREIVHRVERSSSNDSVEGAHERT